MKSLVISIIVFLFLCGTALFLVFIYLTDQTPKEVIDDIVTEGKLFLYQYDMVEKLSSDEMTQLYQNTCTRKCHGTDVIENKPRTAAEWEEVMIRMKAPDRADINDHHAQAITRYLQEHFLSNLPTVLPEKTMRFVRRYLWKSDFGESDLYLDIIYVPREQRSLLPYLVASNSPPAEQGALFVIYINTHQGTLPPWNLAEMATLQDNSGHQQNAIDWQVLYQDNQRHHNQGILTFPDIDVSKSSGLDVAIHLPGMKKRIFQWSLPIPPYTGNDHVEQ